MTGPKPTGKAYFDQYNARTATTGKLYFDTYATNPELFVPEDEEEKQKREREEFLNKLAAGDPGYARGNVSAALAGGAYGLWQDIKQGVREPEKALTGLGEGATNVGKALLPWNLPETVVGIGTGIFGQAKNLLELAAETLPGIDRLKPEEQEKKIWQAAADVGAWYTGMKTGNVLGNVKNIKSIKALAKIEKSPLDEVAKTQLRLATLDALSPAAQATLLQTQIPTGAVRNAFKAGRGAALGAAPFGFLYGETPEERISGAMQFGALGAILGGTFEGVRTKLKAGSYAAAVSNLKETLGSSRIPKVPEDFAGAPKNSVELIDYLQKSGDKSEATTLLRSLLRKFAKDKVAIVTDVPEISKFGDEIVEGPDLKYSLLTHTKADGTRVAMIAPEGSTLPLDKRQISQFRSYGVYGGMPVEHNGKLYSVSMGDRPFRQGKVTLVDDNNVSVGSRLVDELVYVDQLPQKYEPTIRVIEEAKRLVPDFEEKARARLKDLHITEPGEAAATIEAFARETVGLNRVPIPAIKKFLDAELSPEEAVLLDDARTKLIERSHKYVGELGHEAVTRGYKIDYSDGKIDVVDQITNETKYSFENVDQVKQFLKTTNSHPAGELVGIRPDVPTNLPPPEVKSPSRFEMWNARFNIGWLGRKMIEPYQFFSSLDILHPELNGLFTKHFMGTQVAGRKGIQIINEQLAALAPVAKQLKESKNLSSELVAHWLEAVSYDEAIGSNPRTRLIKGRDVNALEKTDTGFILSQLTELKQIENVAKSIYNTILDAANQKLKTPEAILDLYRTKHMLKLTQPEAKVGELIFGNRFRYAGRMGEYSAHVPLELARLKLGKTVSKADLGKLHNLTPEDLKPLEGIRDWFDKAGTKFGISEEQKLNHYYPRIYIENEPYRQIPMEAKHLYENPDFDHALHRLGVRGDTYIKDAAYAVLSYAHKGTRKQVLLPAIQEFERNVFKTLDNVTVSDKYGRNIDAGTTFKRMTETYLREFQHFASPDELASQYIREELADRLKMNSVDFNKAADRFVGLTSFVTMGGNPIMGLRDFSSMLQMLAFRFGYGSVKEILELDNQIASKMTRKALTDVLREGGDIPGKLHRWMYRDFDTPPDGFKRVIGDNLAEMRAKVGEKAFELSAQEQVYEKMHRAVYNWSMDKYTKSLNEYVDHKNVKKFMKEIQVNRHDQPVQAAFKEAFESGEFHEAGKLLARANGWESLAVYGLANYPIGWSSSWGRVFGQFGKWPLWAIRQLGALAGRPDKTKLAARWAASTSLLAGLGAGTGINFQSWVMSPFQMVYLGGPAFDMAWTAAQAIGGQDPRMKELAWRKAMDYLPYNPMEEEWFARQLKQTYIPVPYSIWNLLEATGAIQPTQMMEEVYWSNPQTAMAKALGFSVAPWRLGGLININPAAESARPSSGQKLFEDIIQ